MLDYIHDASLGLFYFFSGRVECVFFFLTLDFLFLFFNKVSYKTLLTNIFTSFVQLGDLTGCSKAIQIDFVHS